MNRADEIRLLALEAVHKAGKGHIGGVLSMAEILATLYGGVLRPQDRFILSKGHAAIGLYAALAQAGRFDRSELARLNHGGMLGEHPCRAIPGVEVTSGSLGHGLGIACGLALAEKLAHRDGRVFVLMGDGECWEGSVWEAAMFGAHHKLNVVAIIDRNGYAVQGATEDIMGHRDLAEKFKAFGWDAITCGGHNERLLAQCLDTNGPRVVIANTIKGNGVSFMEHRKDWHHGSISDEQMARAREELHGHA